MFDNSAWNIDDKEWLQSRKDEWRHIQKNLKKMKGWLRGSYLKHHKTLFFEGFVEEQMFQRLGGYEFGHALPLFLMWYHPVSSRESIQSVFDDWHEPNGLKRARNLLFELPSDQFVSDYGMLGGRESDIVAVLNPSGNIENKREFQNARESYLLCMHPDNVAQYCLGGIYPHIMGESVNPYSPGQFLWNGLCANIQNVTQPAWVKLLRDLITAILRYDLESNTEESVGFRLASKLKGQYERRDFPEAMLAFWDEINAELQGAE